jgi:patatin-like phospholipase/acyl hydrolase
LVENVVKYKIISFDGGGLRGLISVGIIARIVKYLRADWYQDANFYAGTSTGSIIALNLANGKNIQDVSDFYETYGPAMFNKRSWYYFSSIFKLFHVGYKNKILRHQLHVLFNNKKLTELEKQVLVVSYNLYSAQGMRKVWKPKIFHNFKGTVEHSKYADDITIVDALLSSSAAPTYLPSHGHFIDGGVCANNPSMCAVTQVLDLRNADKTKLSDITLISFGTGDNPTPIKETNLKWGILKWSTKLLKLVFEGSNGIADYQCRQLLGKDSYLRIDIDLDETIELDNAQKIDDMKTVVDRIPQSKITEWGDWIRAHW